MSDYPLPPRPPDLRPSPWPWILGAIAIVAIALLIWAPWVGETDYPVQDDCIVYNGETYCK